MILACTTMLASSTSVSRSRSPPLSCRGLGTASFSPRNLLEIIRAFFFGLRDSLLGLIHVFRLDSRAEKRRAKRASRRMPEGSGRSEAAARDSPVREEAPTTTGSPDTLAKRRALERREREKRPVATLSQSRRTLSESDDSPHIKERILLCCGLNVVVFYVAKQLFVQVVLPLVKVIYLLAASATFFSAAGPMETEEEDVMAADTFWSDRIEPSLNFFKSAALTMPLFILCKVVNAVLYQEIADSAFRQSRGRARMMSSLSVMISDVIISILVELLFLAQGTACAFLPIPGVGKALSFFHLSLLYSLYSFEYKW